MKRKFFLLLIFLGLISSLFGSIDEKLRHISWDEKLCMRKFFDFVIHRDQAAHTLYFENKPVCLTGILIKDKYRTFRDVLYLKGWRAFRKNEHLFEHPNFIFNECITGDDEFKVLNIYIINKGALQKCLKQNVDVFKESLGGEFTPEWLMEKLEEGYTIIDLINSNEMLLGILLGFGKEASRAYQVAHDEIDSKESVPEWSLTYCGIDSKSPKGCPLYPIAFMGDPQSLEVKNLISTYETELEIFWHYYQTKNDSLFVFLECLCKK
jgi:hypothetical protein